MAEISKEVLIEELKKLDERAEALIAAREETISYMRETNRLVAEQELRDFQEMTQSPFDSGN